MLNSLFFKTPPAEKATQTHRLHYSDLSAAYKLSVFFKSLLKQALSQQKEIVFLCIGTDRSTGDALGPLVGSHIYELCLDMRPYIYGTLDHPVHAVNLKETLKIINKKHPNAYIIAIDACLGKYESIGFITAGEGTIQPGAGVNKRLPEVGHFYFSGIVNVGGFMEYTVLQNTRLSIVMHMANAISRIITQSIPIIRNITNNKTLA